MPAAAVAFHVLIVEDDPSSSEFVYQALARKGFEADVAVTVGEALLHIEQDWPQAVILDLRLPDADGTVLLRRLKRDARTTRVAVVTGVPDLSGFIEIMHFPPDVLLQKPVNLRKLLRWLEHARLTYETGGATNTVGGYDDDDDDNAGRDGVASDVSARREPRLPARGRDVMLLPRWEDSDAQPERARLLDCSAHGIAVARPAPMEVGELFAVYVNLGGPTTMVLYTVRNCRALTDGTFKIGAELSGFVGAPDEDPQAVLRALLQDGPV